MVQIHPGLEIIDLGLYLVKENIIIFSDFHLGYEEAMARGGVLLPRYQFKDTEERLKKIFEKIGIKLKAIIITGDLKHEFGTINRQEWRDVNSILNLFGEYTDKIILLKGNHDPLLPSIVKRKGITLRNSYRLKDFLIMHGDILPKNEVKEKVIIMGHEHPAISVSDGITTERVKSFIKGKWKDKIIIVLPSFNLVTEGTDVKSDRLLSPFLKDVSNFEAFAVPEFDKVLYFGKIKNLNSKQ
ncbi:MAG: metallophosphoesterase [DPANN group archaeon]|nr:metallophosphoesterase [DPANN group archaeon]